MEGRIIQPIIDVSLDNKYINQRLLQLTLKTGYDIVQRNGQRYYGPAPNWTGPPPEKGSEVFIGRLPKDCFEDELVPLLETIGPIYTLRMMLNFTGYNRGYAFVNYFNPTTAWEAVDKLNHYEIRPGRKLGVSKSLDNCRLYVGRIPLNMTKSNAWEEMVKICPTIKDIIMYFNPKNRKENRGFMFLEFESHRSAAMAKRNFVPGAVKIWKQLVVVDWATPEPDVNPHVMATIRKLFFRNFPPTFNEESIRRLLQDVIPHASVERIYLTAHYGFVHFDTRAHAELAEEHLSKVCFDGEYLEVHWARPRSYDRNILYAPHCRSVPARSRQERQCQKYPVMASPAPDAVVPASQVPQVQQQVVPVPHQRAYAVQLQPYNPAPVYYY